MLILSIFLTNCSGVKQLEIFKQEVPREKLNLNTPTPLELENLRWIIITSKNADEVFKKLEEQGIDPVLWGLTDKDFELQAKELGRKLAIENIELVYGGANVGLMGAVANGVLAESGKVIGILPNFLKSKEKPCLMRLCFSSGVEQVAFIRLVGLPSAALCIRMQSVKPEKEENSSVLYFGGTPMMTMVRLSSADFWLVFLVSLTVQPSIVKFMREVLSSADRG